MLSLVNSYNDPTYVDKLAAYRPFFSQLLKQDKSSAILFHCTGGRDRTGVATALLMHILGVSKDQITNNYLESNIYLQPERDNPDSLAFERFRFSNVFLQPSGNRKFQKVAKLFGTTPEKIKDAVELKPEYLENLFNNIKNQYGTIEEFFSMRLGIGSKEIENVNFFV